MKVKNVVFFAAALFISVLLTGVFPQQAYADIASEGTSVPNSIVIIVIAGIAIAIIWVVCYFIIKKIKKKNHGE